MADITVTDKDRAAADVLYRKLASIETPEARRLAIARAFAEQRMRDAEIAKQEARQPMNEYDDGVDCCLRIAAAIERGE